MNNIKTFFFAGIILSIFFVSCGERQYALTGILTFDVVDEKGEPFKKEDATRFELYPITAYHYVAGEIKVKEGKYLVYETECYDILSGKFDHYQRLKDVNPPLSRILKLRGVTLVDKLGEYRTWSYYFDSSSVGELPASTSGHLIYQIKYTIRLNKKE